LNNVFTGGGFATGQRKLLYSKRRKSCRKESESIKVICHPSFATVCKRNQKVDKKGVVSFFRVGLRGRCGGEVG